MNYRSIQDMASVIRTGLSRLPHDIDLVVGIPRSGMLAASIIALHANLKFVSLDAFLANIRIHTGLTRHARHCYVVCPFDARHVLLVDDSASSGVSMNAASHVIESSKYSGRITTCAIYATAACMDALDVHFEIVPQTRLFEWNLMHRDFLSECCVDMDGVLCMDPDNAENDDGQKYVGFLQTARPMMVPSYRIGRVVTSRLEKYRAHTMSWLQRHGIEFGSLDMLDLPDAETRRRLGAHASFKAEIYRTDPAMRLFVESERTQAIEIARRAGKPALSINTQELFQPGFNLPYAQQASRRWADKAQRMFDRLWRSTLPTK